MSEAKFAPQAAHHFAMRDTRFGRLDYFFEDVLIRAVSSTRQCVERASDLALAALALESLEAFNMAKHCLGIRPLGWRNRRILLDLVAVDSDDLSGAGVDLL